MGEAKGRRGDLFWLSRSGFEEERLCSNGPLLCFRVKGDGGGYKEKGNGGGVAVIVLVVLHCTVQLIYIPLF